MAKSAKKKKEQSYGNVNVSKKASKQASKQPSKQASQQPSKQAPQQPSKQASQQPSKQAPQQASNQASKQPSNQASQQPSNQASRQPSKQAGFQDSSNRDHGAEASRNVPFLFDQGTNHQLKAADMLSTQTMQLSMLKLNDNVDMIGKSLEEARTSPLLTPSVYVEAQKQWKNTSVFPAFGLLAGNIGLASVSNAAVQNAWTCEKPSGNRAPKVKVESCEKMVDETTFSDHTLDQEAASQQTREQEYPSKVHAAGETAFSRDPRIFLNVNAPWSAFICGSQGSGKSHSLACMLENCLISSTNIGQLPQPLCGLVLHYDSCISAFSAQACEAAYLATAGVSVRVLASPTNVPRMKRLYSTIDSRIVVRPLAIDASHLTADNLLALMAVDSSNSRGPLPLYVHTATKALREMALAQISRFSNTTNIVLSDFYKKIKEANLSPDQRRFFEQRMEIVESFMGGKNVPTNEKLSWVPVPGQLTIIDLSCPFVDSDTACGLFNICLGIFLSQENKVGRIIALDEAHKFMTSSNDASRLTETLKSVIRLQRHLACRVIIATQEPTISTSLLDLCAITIVHRFTSPNWFKTLRGHLAAVAEEKPASNGMRISKMAGANHDDSEDEGDGDDSLFAKIVKLNVGEALLCAPSALLAVSAPSKIENESGNTERKLRKAGSKAIKVKVRQRISGDGGKSIMATSTA